MLLPPAFLIAAACVLVGVTPYAWGAAEPIDAPAWMPAAFGLIVAFGGLLVGGYSLKKTLQETPGDFEVFGLQTVFGILMFVSRRPHAPVARLLAAGRCHVCSDARR